MQQPAQIITQSELSVYANSWRISLEADNRPATTRRIYLLAVHKLDAYLADMGMPQSLSGLTSEHIRQWQRHELSRSAPGSVRVYHAALKVFFNWLLSEGELRESPLGTVKAPTLPETAVRVLTEDELIVLVRCCERDDSFAGRRDTALLRVFIDTGCRLAEVAGLRADSVDMKTGLVEVMGKGHRPRIVHLRPRALRSVDRYMRKRALHPHAGKPALWLGQQGGLHPNTIAQIVRRRGIQAGLGNDLHPHLLRHAFAHWFLQAGGREGDLQALGGWRSVDVMRRYAAAARADRAIAAHGAMEERV